MDFIDVLLARRRAGGGSRLSVVELITVPSNVDNGTPLSESESAKMDAVLSTKSPIVVKFQSSSGFTNALVFDYAGLNGFAEMFFAITVEDSLTMYGISKQDGVWRFMTSGMV